jgi:hypothetical protein
LAVVPKEPHPYKAPHLIHLGCFHLVDDDLHLLSIKTLEKAFIYLL